MTLEAILAGAAVLVVVLFVALLNERKVARRRDDWIYKRDIDLSGVKPRERS